jgi:ABC-type branched-subunit amino acid transport system substrate-binding protein
MQLAAKELRRLKYSGGLMAIQIDKAGVAAANGSLEGTIFAQFPESNPEFVKRYTQRYGENPSLSADTAYDSVMLIARAAEKAGTLDVQVLKMEMPKTEFQGASGKIALDDKRAIIREPSYFTVAGETFKRIDG